MYKNTSVFPNEYRPFRNLERRGGVELPQPPPFPTPSTRYTPAPEYISVDKN